LENFSGVIMKLEITDIKFKENIQINNKILKELINIIEEKLFNKNIRYKIVKWINNDMDIFGFEFQPVDKNKIFISKIQNKILLKNDDLRRKKLNRDYLKSYRLTLDQEKYMWEEAINQTLNNLDLLATIIFTDKTGKEYIIRQNMINQNWPIQSLTYPINT